MVEAVNGASHERKMSLILAYPDLRFEDLVEGGGKR
jgi:2-oxo-4-hydroxy-4-carboxy--5-ureidoimidazoline (OHCU) decarboxylase